MATKQKTTKKSSEVTDFEWNSIEVNLKAPMSFKYRVGHTSPKKPKPPKWVFMLAYIDARDAMDRLDNVVGPENWQCEHFMVGENTYCRVSIYDPGRCIWVTKTDCGVESNIEGPKGQASDAFKRACVHWGIGRFLYDFPTIMLPYAKYKDLQYKPELLHALCEKKREDTSGAPKSSKKKSTGKSTTKKKKATRSEPEPEEESDDDYVDIEFDNDDDDYGEVDNDNNAYPDG